MLYILENIFSVYYTYTRDYHNPWSGNPYEKKTTKRSVVFPIATHRHVI